MLRRATAAVLALLAATEGPLLAATRITVRMRADADASAGRPALERTAVVWLEGGKLREDQQGSGARRSVIVDGEAKELVVIDHAARVVHRLPTPVDITALVPEAMRPALESQARQTRMDVRIRPTEERRTIGRWSARKFEVAMTNPRGTRLEMDLWTTLDPGFDVAAFKALTGELSRLQPTGGEWMAQLLAIEGFPVLRETRVLADEQVLVSREELVSVETLEAPDDTFLAPAGYASTPFELGPPPPPGR